MTAEEMRKLLVITKNLTLASFQIAELQDTVTDDDELDRVDALALELHDANVILKDLYSKCAS